MKKLFLLSLVGLCAAYTFGKSAETSLNSAIQDNFVSEFVAHSWTASNGLPGNTITSLLQDDAGYIYIGTYDGMSRFDGVDFLTINHNYDPRYNFVSARTLFQDKRGNLWIGTNDEGIACASRDGEVQMFTTADGLPNNSIRAITEDRDGNIWIGTASGIAYITPDLQILRPQGLEAYGAENMIVICLYCDTAGRVWVTSHSENGLYYYVNHRFEQYTGIKSVKNPVVSYITQDSSGSFWFGVCPHYAVRTDGIGENFFDIGHGEQRGTIVNCIFQDKNSNIWCAMDSGITIIRSDGMSYYDKSLGLTDNNVNDIIEDREGNIWLGTDRGGLEKLSLSKFKTISVPTTVNSIAEDRVRGVVWLGGDNGLYCYDYTNASFVENDFTRSCVNVRIRHVGIARNGDLLVSAYNRLGQSRFSSNGKMLSWMPEQGLAGSKVRLAMELSNGDLYVGTTTGLSVIDHETGKIRSYARENGLPHDYIMCLYEDKNGEVWCGTDGGGIFVLKNEKLVRTYTTEDGLAGNVIFKILKLDESDDLWICTGTGVSRLRNGEFFSFNSSNGLGTDSVFQLIPDYTGAVWLTSNRGIGSFKLTQADAVASGKEKSLNTKYFGVSDGLRSGGVTSTSLSMTDGLGRIWFTLIDGFAIYDPVKVTNKTIPSVQLQDITVDNELASCQDQLLVLQPSAKRLRIKFTCLSFISSEQIEFRYKLTGFDADYSEWSTERVASYTNLPHGKYSFSVQAMNGDDVVGTLEVPLSIVKRPFLWELWWFWAGIILFVASCACFIVMLRFRRLQKYQQELENEVSRRTEQLRVANAKTQELLLNILPRDIARELTEHPNELIAKQYPNVCVLFADIVGFTKLSDGLSAGEIVKLLNTLFSKFDTRLSLEGVEKIKTIGDAYMAACGLTNESDNGSAKQMISLALGLFEDLAEFNRTSGVKLNMRIGINSGTLVAGVIGKTKFIYDIWGDTVNVASRMESTGRPGYVHVTEGTYTLTKDVFVYNDSEEIEVKGKGRMKTYFIKSIMEDKK